jgi:hypothetical protein
MPAGGTSRRASEERMNWVEEVSGGRILARVFVPLGAVVEAA